MLTGNYAWFGDNRIYVVEVIGEGYVPVFPSDYGLPPGEARRAMELFIKEHEGRLNL